MNTKKVNVSLLVYGDGKSALRAFSIDWIETDNIDIIADDMRKAIEGIE